MRHLTSMVKFGIGPRRGPGPKGLTMTIRITDTNGRIIGEYLDIHQMVVAIGNFPIASATRVQVGQGRITPIDLPAVIEHERRNCPLCAAALAAQVS